MMSDQTNVILKGLSKTALEESLALLYLSQQDLSNKTPEELACLFVDVNAKIKNELTKCKQSKLSDWFNGE